MYDTEDFGKQPAKKSVRILTLPPILMIQLKRFEFSPITYKNQKIMTKFRYPNEIDFSKWLVHTEQKNQYQLYAVLVHEGTKAESGHYYVYIKDENSWYKFNDQEVTLASPRQVFEYNFGGENQVVDLDSREMKVLNRSFTCSSTAYMLVYVQKNMSKHLLNNKIEYPSWLKTRQITKQEQKQQIKARKNYYHNIKTLTWQDEFYNNDASYIGLIERSEENRNISSESCLQKIAKNQKIEEWLQQYNQNDIGVYLYITNADKAQYETVVNLQHRKSTFQELLRDQASPTFLFLPKIISIHSYLYIIKLVTLKDQSFMLTESEPQKIKFNPEIQIKFHDIMQVDRQQKNFQLVSKLQDRFNEEGYSYRFFYEQKKELKSIYKDNNLVLGSATPRNILQIIIVQKIPEEIIKMNIKFTPTEKWYLSQRNTVEILMRSEGGKYQFMVYVDKNMDIDSLRQLIFEEQLRGDETYASPANIVLKSKPKKTSKIFVQQTGALKVKDLLKGCDKQKIIVFEPSSLNAEERLNQTEIKFYYRFQDFSYSQCFRIVIDKQSKSEETNIFRKIREHEQIRINLQKEKLHGLRLLLLSKDRQTINDVVSANGSVPGKGELVSVLEKQKNTNLIAEGYPIREISEDVCPIIINHKSQNGDKIGKPRYWEVKKDMSLIQLRETVTQLIKDESYEWQEKLYPVNPFKLYIYAYVKDIRKKVQLFDEQEIQELEANNMKPTVIDLEDNGSQDSKKIEEQNENEEKSNKNENEEDINNQGIKQKNEEANGTKARRQEGKKIQNKIDYRSFTIENKFPKAKFLKIFIFHLYLVRNNQMKLNV